ncbi:MAG: ACT domain-containing protein [Lachnospiraceae bacterium]|nr:ACT domain-containing protein [Lachnospiraceae bacterium]
MMEQTEYYVIRRRAVPDVLLKVVEANRLVKSGQVSSVQEAVDQMGISRSSFYKYRDDIIPFHDNAQGTTITLSLQINDVPGLLSQVLQIIAQSNVNILTIHQSIPINGVASLSISVQVLMASGDTSAMVQALEALEGVGSVEIIGKE